METFFKNILKNLAVAHPEAFFLLIAGAKVVLYFYSPNILLKKLQNCGVFFCGQGDTYIYNIIGGRTGWEEIGRDRKR